MNRRKCDGESQVWSASLWPGMFLAMHPTRRVGNRRSTSCKNRLDHLAMNVREPVAPALEKIRQPFVVHTEQMQHRGVEVMHVNAVFRDVVAELVGLAVHQTRLHATASHPDRETAWVMIAAIIVRR